VPPDSRLKKFFLGNFVPTVKKVAFPFLIFPMVNMHVLYNESEIRIQTCSYYLFFYLDHLAEECIYVRKERVTIKILQDKKI